MKRCTKWFALVALLFTTGARAGKIALMPLPMLEDASLNINVQLQAWIQATEPTTPSSQATFAGSKAWNAQAFMRRIRTIISGDITKQLHFFVQLDSPNFGRTNLPISSTDGANRLLLQDAQLIFEPIPGVFFEAGELLLPLSHQQVQSTTSFITLDIHGNTIRFPGASAPNTATNGLRELGVQTRGWAFDKKLGWRLGAYNGQRGAVGVYDPTNAASINGLNPDSIPQLGGYLHFNFLDSEERGWLYQGMYFNTKPILSVGAGFGWQPKAIRGANATITRPQDWRALAADVYGAFPLDKDNEAVAQFAFYNYDFGTANPNTGNGFFAEVGYRWTDFQPFVSYEYFDTSETLAPTTVPNNSRIWWTGINWWFRRLNSLKLEVEFTRVARLNQNVRSITMQWQLFF